MAVIRCNQGHYYDEQKFSRCPHCGIFTNIEWNMERQEPEAKERTVAMKQEWKPDCTHEQTVAFETIKGGSGDEQKTIGVYAAEKGNQRVTGWLVCVSGNEQGRDYRLHHGFNYVGRGYDMAVCIAEDQSISRHKHCAIVYDGKSNTFSLVPTSGNLVFKAGEPVAQPVRLETGDMIRIGESEFEFIAFCREGRVWEKE